MPAGRPRKPTNVLQLSAKRLNPSRLKEREDEPKVELLTQHTPPEWMKDKVQRRCYREIMRKIPANVLGLGDTMLVEIVSGLMAEYRKDPMSMKAPKLARLMTGLGQLGLTPADRSRTSVIPKPQENRFAKFTTT